MMTGAATQVEIGFYHCTREPLLPVARKLAVRAMAAKQRLLVVGSQEQCRSLDSELWAQDGFLAHGFAGDSHEDAQPILLSATAVPGNGAKLLMLLGSGLPAQFEPFSRILLLFEDESEAHTRARADWLALSARDNVLRTYWQQKPTGGWGRKI